MPARYYQDKLYPFQNRILQLVQNAGVDFYLTGGTALSRCYLNHRYSDDLDFFVNSHDDFKEQCNTVISDIGKSALKYEIGTTSKSFIRILLYDDELVLKVDFVNDVEFRYGSTVRSSIFHRVDNWRNILSNKICALSRREAKDIVDMLFLAKENRFDWEKIIEESRKKDTWVSPLEIAKILHEFPIEQLETIKWIESINTEEISDILKRLHDDVFYGKPNSLHRE